MPTTKAHFEAIGRVAYEWSRLEQTLQTAIALVADIDRRKSLILTNAGSVKSWTETLSRLVENSLYKPELAKRTRKLGERISEQLYPQRNMVIHGIWSESWDAVGWRRLRLTSAEPDFVLAHRQEGRETHGNGW